MASDLFAAVNSCPRAKDMGTGGRASASAESSLETVEDQVEPELEVLLAPRPHDLGDDLDDVGVLVRGQLTKDAGRHLPGLAGLDDVAGVVEAVGSDVTRFRPGDEVFGIGKGAFAQYARAPGMSSRAGTHAVHDCLRGVISPFVELTPPTDQAVLLSGDP